MQGDEHPAARAAEDEIILGEIRIMQLFLARREAAISTLFNRRVLQRNPLIELLMREVFIAHATATPMRITDYQARLRDHATGPSVTAALRRLCEARLVLLQKHEHDKRVVAVVATRKLVEFYRKTMPSLRSDARELLC